MLQQTRSLRLHQLGNHVAKDGSHSIEALVGGADVVETVVIEEDLLDNEDGDGLAKFGAGLHDAQAERDDFGGEQEVDDFRRVVLDKSADDTETGQAQVFERSRLGRSVEEWVQEQRDVR